MQNGLKIKWTEEAINNLEDILSYLKIRWTTREINRFFIKLEKQLIILSLFPEAFPRSQINFVHRCVFSKQLTIYYSVENENLVILSLFDNRRDS
jgi:plasmid stabilization system protein ParE